MKDRFIFIAAALESIELIQSYTEGYDLTDFLADRKTQPVRRMCVGWISEA